MDSGSPGENSKSLGRILRIKNGYRKNIHVQGAPLDSTEFTRFTAKNCTHTRAANITLLPFTTPIAFKDRIVRAVHESPAGKATGEDDIFSEALALTPELSSEILYKI